VFAIVSLLVTPVLDEYQDLIDIEIILPVPSFEKPHYEDTAAGSEKDFHSLISSISLNPPLFFIRASFFFPISSPIFSPSQQALILRC
jgi:hypothetical protein